MFAFFAFLSTSELAIPQPTKVIEKLDVASLCDLVESMTAVALKYRDDPTSAPTRVFHPYAVGFTPSNNILLFGHQVDGYSKSAKSDNAVGWRSFRVDKIASLARFDQVFRPVRPDYPSRKIIARYACKNRAATQAYEEVLCKAAKNNLIVTARHRDDPPDQPARVLHPHAVGLNTQKSPMVFVFQTEGYARVTHDGKPTIPGWRTFRLDRLTDIHVSEDRYTPRRPELSNLKNVAEFLCATESVKGLRP
jgi:hypothetical protein